MSRLFVGGISTQTSSTDLISLFSKVAPVSEVYVPPPTVTGLRRDFAIVSLTGDVEDAKKCAKSLNGSLWKGSKLRVEIANQFYKNRLENERKQEIENEESAAALFQQEPKALPPISTDIIKLRKLKHQEVPIAISMKPTVSLTNKPTKGRRNAGRIIPCGVKRILDPEVARLFASNTLASSESEMEAGSDSETEKNNLEASKEKEQNSGTAVQKPTSNSGEVTAILKKLSTGAVQPIGGGARKGFGTISAPSAAVASKTVPANCSSDKNLCATDSAGKVDCCVEEEELFIPSYLLEEEGEELGDDEPCVTVADVEEEALARERQRALEVLEQLLYGGGAVTTKKDKKSNKKEEKSKKVGFAEEKNTEHQIVDDTVVPEALSSEAQETLDILNELKAVATASDAVSKSKTSTEDGAVDSEGQLAVSAATAAEMEQEVLNTKDGYANMNQLKNIFYREGGVWWGDDGTLSGAVGKGNAAADPLFLEAEKHGIDIRLTKQASTTGNTVTAATQGAGGLFNFLPTETATEELDSAAQPSENKQMLFGFFGASDQSESALEPANPFLTKANISAVVASDAAVLSPATNSALPVPALGKRESSLIPTADADGKSGSASVRTVEIAVTAAELVALARKFGREKSVDALTAEWRDGKDRLVLDYKRKRKDMKRRTAAWSSSNLSNVFGERSKPTSSGDSGRPRSADGTAAGSVGNKRSAPTAHYMRGRNRGGGGSNSRKRARN